MSRRRSRRATSHRRAVERRRCRASPVSNVVSVEPSRDRASPAPASSIARVDPAGRHIHHSPRDADRVLIDAATGPAQGRKYGTKGEAVNLDWHVTAADKACVQALMEKQGTIKIVRDRYDRNLAESKSQITKDRLWRAMVCMRLTTLARSGPKSKIAQFQSLSPFPLAYDATYKQQSRENFILNTLRTHQVGRHPRTISKQVANNLKRLEDGEWPYALNQCNRLVRGCMIDLERRETEREVADYIDEKFEGFGPKQSRNVLQALGLTRYEIPIDSRVTDWLNDELQFPFQVTSAALFDRHYYRLILDAVCKLSEECKIFPCVLDAAIFGAKDDDVWSVEELRY
jgi:hypothetical protein